MQQYLIIALAIVGYAASAAVVTVMEVQGSTIEADLNRTLLNIHEHCHQAKETGRCFALFHRYAFNVESFACEEFIYGGCAGNNNNFETKEECERFCSPAPNAESSTEVTVAESTDVSVDASSSTTNTSTESAKELTESTDASVDASSSTASSSTESAQALSESTDASVDASSSTASTSTESTKGEANA